MPQTPPASTSRQRQVVLAVVAVALLVLVLALAMPVKGWWDKRQFQGNAVDQVSTAGATCGPITTKKATGGGLHIDPNTDPGYTDAPPAFGPHYPTWLPMDKKFFAVGERPPLGNLVHNLEHGFTILWYDATVAGDAAQLDTVKRIADQLSGTTNPETKFLAVPWGADDEGGKGFPSGMHVALTHWSAGGAGNTDPSRQVGVWQYCTAPSGAALKAFMTKYPYSDSPEPNA